MDEQVQRDSERDPQRPEYDIVSAAEYLGCSTRYLRGLCLRQLIPHRRKPTKGTWGRIAFTLDDLRAIVDAWSVGSTTPRSAKSKRGPA